MKLQMTNLTQHKVKLCGAMWALTEYYLILGETWAPEGNPHRQVSCSQIAIQFVQYMYEKQIYKHIKVWVFIFQEFIHY